MTFRILPDLDLDETVIDDSYDEEDEALTDAVAAAQRILTADERDDLDLAFASTVEADWF